jgi:serine/threonine protein kinase/tetratricopeptide (TPR) repeat protein
MTSLATGSKLGPYEIVAPLGSGGMGEVYRARDPRLGREVALKVLPEAVASHPDRLARFEREAKTVAALNHPHIVTIYSIEEAGAVRFLTMELVEGQSLDRLVISGGLPLPRVLELSVALTDALAAAHDKGIVHRDLKPANVMVTREGRLKVLDFGLAKLEERPGHPPEFSLGGTLAATVEAPISTAGQVVGTVPYMAPEQLRGEPVDARADLFAFGIVLYELVTGQRPFAGKTFADVSSAILRDAPKPIQMVRAELPRDLERIVGRCLEKDRERRFQTAKDVRNELEIVRREIESVARPPARAAAPSAETPSIAVLPFANMSADPDNEYFSDGLSEELLNVLAKNPGLKVAGRTSSFAFKGKHEDLREIGHKLGVATLLEGSVRRAGSRVRITAQLVKVADGFHLWSETYDRVLDDLFAVQDDIARSVAAAMNVALLGQAAAPIKGNAETYDLVLQANHLTNQQTGVSLEKAVSLYREALARAPEDARAWAGLARAYTSQASQGFADNLEGYRSAREAVEKALALDDRLPEAHENLGFILAAFEFRFAEADAALRRARELAPGDGRILATSAILEAISDRLEEALRLSERATELDPLSPMTHLFRGRILTWARRDEEALVAYRKALELAPGMTTAHAAICNLLVWGGRAREGAAEAEKEPAAGYRNWALAIAHHALGDTTASNQALAALIAEGEEWGFQIAAVHAFRGEIEKGFDWLERSYFLRDSGIPLVKLTRHLESLRGDPRWPRLLARLGLGA